MYYRYEYLRRDFLTEGSNQGLFIIIAIIIFGLFVLLSYLLFRDNLGLSLKAIFKDSLEQSNNILNGEGMIMI